MFDESKHKRDSDGKFAKQDGHDYSDDVNGRIRWAKDNDVELPLNDDGSVDDIALQGLRQARENNVVKVNLDSDIQKQLTAAKSQKERQKIAFRYIMDNLRGVYSAPDGRTVAIERVGASKITSIDRRDKLRACPALAEMIKAGEYDHSARGEDKHNKKFEEFVYYRVRVKMGDDIYKGLLNVGIRKDGSSTLYDLRPFDIEKK